MMFYWIILTLSIGFTYELDSYKRMSLNTSK